MTKDLLYYLEINFASIAVMIVLIISDLYAGKNNNEPRLYLRLAISNIIFCLSDVASIALRGTNYAFSNLALWVVNGIYIMSLSLISYFWLRYACAVINRKFLNKKFILITIIPIIAILAMLIASIKTGWLFSIDENNLYQRGNLIWIHWIQMWSYLLVPSICALVIYIRNRKNRDSLSIALFAIAPFICGIIQMRFYGITIMQLGISISILIVYLRLQNRQMFTDTLTGLYNRGELNKSLERILDSNQPFYMLLIDINNFKEINDSNGHLVGDQVLIETSNILKKVATTREENVSLFRYGGDEFIVIGSSSDSNAPVDFSRSLNAEINQLNKAGKYKFDLSLSIGLEQGYSSNYNSADDLLNLVDSDMYKQKSLYHKREQNEKRSHNMYSSHNSSFGTKSSAIKHSQDVNQKELNKAVIKMWLLIVTVLVVSYLFEVFKNERSITYYIIFVSITLLPWLLCFAYYKKNPESKWVSYSAQFSYLAMYSFVMLTGNTNMVFSYILVFSSLLVLYHNPRLIAFYGLISVGINIVSIAIKYSQGQITLANSRDYEIQIALLILCFINMYIATKIYNRVIKVNQIYVDDLQHTTEEMRMMATESIITIANTIDAKDEYTKGHSQRVADYSLMLARKINMSEEEISNIYSIALLHDIGKIGVPDAILNKPGRLTDEEYKQIQQHTVVGSNILKEFGAISGVDIGTRYHHERYDGKGYPDGISGENIPLIARIIAVADSFDAMTSNRVYRNRLDISTVVSELEKGKGTQFDPTIAEYMIQLCNEGKVPIENRNM